MSNTGLIIEERSRDIGDFLVGRLLPFRKKRMVGPFIFVDHMGPAVVKPGRYQDIGQHPHIGLSTLTYLFEGEIMHRDSLGTEQLVSAGSVGWMTAGAGIVHTERTPDNLRNGEEHKLHGFQIWVALPKDKENMNPEFSFTPEGELPKWDEDELYFKLIAGEAFGRKSPVPVYSNLFLMSIRAQENQSLNLSDKLFGEIGICIVKGSITACGDKIEAGNMLIAKSGDNCNMEIAAGSLLLVLGGEPFPEKRFIEWNFVATSKEIITHAKEKWINKEYSRVKDDSSYIPLPEVLIPKK